MEKYTKKATARILKEVLKVNPKASGFTTLDQAFIVLMDHWDMELGIDNDQCILYRDGDKVETRDFKNIWNEKEGDWDWNIIYKTVLEDVIKKRLYKRPKLGKRALAKLEKEKAVAKAKEEKIQKQQQEAKDRQQHIEDLKRRKSNLIAKKSTFKRKGLDISTIENEIERINKELAKTK